MRFFAIDVLGILLLNNAQYFMVAPPSGQLYLNAEIMDGIPFYRASA